MILNSQNDEERIAVEYFGGLRGNFLDIGAWSGRVFSNTLRLAQLGWGGVCIEPSPSACAELLKLHGGSDRITIVNAAIATEPGWAVFHDCGGDGVSTLSTAHRDKWASAAEFRPMHLWAVTLAQLLEKFPGPYQFVSLDVEGLNWPILQQMPLAAMGTRMIVVEHDDYLDEIAAWIEPQGFTLLSQNAENVIYARPQI